uniref:Integrase core domain containing protein n=1 Tax=Solanum tuberosum TaxID=4113 RepID=M1DNZ5_SOLTU
MARYDTMNEETVAMRKEHDVFNKDITMRLQKIRGKCFFFNQEANNGPQDTHPGATEEDVDEDIIYMPPFLGRLKGGDKRITLPAYVWTRSVGARVVPCALIYEHLKVLGVLASIRKDGEAIDPVGSEIWKPFPYHDAIDHNIGRSKGPKDSFLSQSSQKGKAAMGDNNEETGLTDVVVAQPVLAD